MMLANFFGKSKPVNFIIIIGLFLVYYILSFVKDDFIVLLDGFLLNKIAVFLLFLMLFFMYNFILVKNKLTRDNSYAFLFFVVSLGMTPNSMFLDNMLYVHLILLFFLRKVYSLRNTNAVLSKLFDSGLWLGIAFLLVPFSIVYFSIIYAAIFLFYKISLRSIVIPILGFIAPVFIYFTYCFFIEETTQFYKLFDFPVLYDFTSYNTTSYIVTFVLLSVFVCLSILLRTTKIFSVNNKFKRSWALLLFHFLISIVFVVLLENRNGVELISIYIPSTIIIANWLQYIQKKWILELVLLLFLGYSFVIPFII